MEDVFLPFVRNDQYGDRGEKPQPLLEQLWVKIATFTILPLKILAAFLCLTSFFLVCQFAQLLPVSVRPGFIAQLGKIHCRVCLFCMGFVRIRWMKAPANPELADVKPAGIVSNHLGWADILVHMSRFFPSFVARDGTQNLPLVGFISKMMDCVYVDRESKAHNNGGKGVSGQVKARMIETVVDNSIYRPMLLFPEGTTSNGNYMLPFKTGAFLAGLPLQPVIIQYGQAPVSPCWETVAAKRHIFLMLTHLFYTADCYELPVYVPSDAEKNDPALYAANMREYMLEYSRSHPDMRTLLPSLGKLEDKRRYQELLKSQSQQDTHKLQ